MNVDAVVTDGDGNFLPGLKKENFRILEDGKPQIITNFTPSGEAPITIVLLIEFRAHFYTGKLLRADEHLLGIRFSEQSEKE